MVDFANATLRGVQAGAIYVTIALGLNLPFATLNVFNVAHGQMVMVGAVLGVILWQSFHVPVLLALVLAVAGAAAMGALTERVAVRPVVNVRDAAGWVLTTLAVGVIVQTLFAIGLTRQPGSTATRLFPSFLPFQRTVEVGGILLDPKRLFPIVVAVVVTAVLLWFVRSTFIGRALGAVADDREAAALRGLPVAGLSVLSFALGAAIAALAGFSAGPITQADVSGGLALTLKAFVAAAIGGIPEIWGAVVGGLMLGLVEQYTVQYLDSRLQDPVVLLLLLTVLVIRPQGVLGREIRTV